MAASDDIPERKQDRQRRWYLQPATAVAAAAIIASVTMSFISLGVASRERREESLEDQRKALRHAMMELVAVQAEFLALQSEQDFTGARSIVMNTRREMVLDQIEDLLPKLEDDVSANALYLLGTDCLMNGEYAKGKSFFKRALKLSRSLAFFFMTPKTGHTDVELGRAYWTQAIEQTAEEEGSFGRYTRAYTLERWAETELGYGDRDKALELRRKAIAAYLAIGRADPNFSVMVTLSLKRLRRELPVDIELLSSLQGEWLLSYPGPSKPGTVSKSGTVFVDFNTTTGMVMMSALIYAGEKEDKKLIGKWAGGGQFLSATELRIDFFGSVSGTMSLTASIDPVLFTGEEFNLGQEAMKVKLEPTPARTAR